MRSRDCATRKGGRNGGLRFRLGTIRVSRDYCRIMRYYILVLNVLTATSSLKQRIEDLENVEEMEDKDWGGKIRER